MQERLISRLSIFLMVVFAGFIVFYLYRFFSVVVPFAFTQPEIWNTLGMVDKGTQIPTYWRIVFFGMWMVTVCFTFLMAACAIWIVNLIRQGVYFDRRTVVALRSLGAFAACSGIFKIAGASVEPWVLTRFNQVVPRRDIYFWYNSGEVGVVLIGLSLVLLAWVLRVIILTEHENKEFV